MAKTKRKATSTRQPKFGSPAWFKKFPKAAKVKKRAKGEATGR